MIVQATGYNNVFDYILKNLDKIGIVEGIVIVVIVIVVAIGIFYFFRMLFKDSIESTKRGLDVYKELFELRDEENKELKSSLIDYESKMPRLEGVLEALSEKSIDSTTLMINHRAVSLLAVSTAQINLQLHILDEAKSNLMWVAIGARDSFWNTDHKEDNELYKDALSATIEYQKLILKRNRIIKDDYMTLVQFDHDLLDKDVIVFKGIQGKIDVRGKEFEALRDKMKKLSESKSLNKRAKGTFRFGYLA